MIEGYGAWWRTSLVGAVLAAASLGGCSGTVVQAPCDAAVSDLVVIDTPPAASDLVVIDTPPAVDTPVVDAPGAVDASIVDTPPAVDTPRTCDAGATLCGDTCVDTATEVSHCGACNRPCGTGQSCVRGACACPTGQHPVGTVCAADDAPRPIAPISLGDVTQRRPTLRWALPPGVDGAVVELCRDRACTMVLETLRVTGTSARPSADLPARSTVFWRMRGRVGTTERTGASPTWIFHVPARSASTSVDTSFNPHFDVNGDGFDDVVVGAWQADTGGRRTGTASVFYGSATWTRPAAGTAHTPDRLLEGAAENAYFGSSVASAGDINGDGYADLVVGAYGASPGGRNGAGTASVYYGSATWTQPPAGTARTPDRLLEGEERFIRFGVSVAGAGDVNGDGYADLVVGASGASPDMHYGAGTAGVYYGSATWAQPAAGTARTPDRLLEGATDDRFGTSVASAGDMNGDGYSDFVVATSPASSGVRLRVGTANVFYGSAAWIQPATGTVSTSDRLFEGASADDYFGADVASAGDVNGDGYADLLVGSPANNSGGRTGTGTASVYYGSVTWTRPTTGTVSTPDRLFGGTAVVDRFGGVVASAGDVNGDGYADLVVGAPGARPGGRRSAGTASVFYGSATWTQPAAGAARTPDRLLEGAAYNNFGSSVASGGDVNGDGYADLVVGAPGTDLGARFYAGTASVFHGSAAWTPPAAGTASTPDRLLEGAAAYDLFGGSVASAGDVSGDGFDERDVMAYLAGSRGRSFASTALTPDCLLGGWRLHPIWQFSRANLSPSSQARLFARPGSLWARRTRAAGNPDLRYRRAAFALPPDRGTRLDPSTTVDAGDICAERKRGGMVHRPPAVLAMVGRRDGWSQDVRLARDGGPRGGRASSRRPRHQGPSWRQSACCGRTYIGSSSRGGAPGAGPALAGERPPGLDRAARYACGLLSSDTKVDPPCDTNPDPPPGRGLRGARRIRAAPTSSSGGACSSRR